jgi:hypothetical protein
MNPKLTYWARSHIHRLHLLPLPRRHHHDDDCVLLALWALEIPLLKNTQKAFKRARAHTHGVRCYSSSSSSVSLPKHCNSPSSCSFSYYYRFCSAAATTIACLVHCHDNYTDVFHCKQKNRSTGASSSVLLLLC